MQSTRNCKVKKFAIEKDAEYFVRWGKSPPAPDSGLVDPHSVVVYTDGSCRMNLEGQKSAGIGVYFGEGHPCNRAAPFTLEPLTNNRAELMAIITAIDLASDPQYFSVLKTPNEKPRLVIFTDSSYARDSLGKWRQNWTRSNFKDGTILNRDIIEKAWDCIDLCPRQVEIVWRKGHAGIHGNERADAFANHGALQ